MQPGAVSFQAAGSGSSVASAVTSVATLATKVADASITSGAAVLTSPSNPWTAADVGKLVAIRAAGTGPVGTWHISSISAFTSAGSVTIADNAGATLVAGEAVWGTDQTATIQAILTAGGSAVLPTGDYFFSQLLLSTGSSLRGFGWGTRLFQKKATTNAAAIALADGTVYNTFLGYFRLVGNRSTGGASNGFGILLDNSSAPNGTANGPYGGDPDPNHHVVKVKVEDTAAAGVKTANHAQETVLDHVCVARSAGYGFNILANDDRLVGCVAYWNDNDGFYLGADDNKLTHCKAFQNGHRTGTGGGFLVQGNICRLVQCMSEQNRQYGFCFQNGSRIQGIGLSSQSDGKDGTTAGFLFDNTNDGQYELILDAWDGALPIGVKFQNAADRNSIRLAAPAATYTTLFSGSFLANSIDVNNNRGGFRTIAFTSSLTPDPTLGMWHAMTLTAGTLVNAPTVSWPGARLVLDLTEDATGGRGITLNAVYKTLVTPVTTASKRNVLEFVCDGTNWVAVGATAGF